MKPELSVEALKSEIKSFVGVISNDPIAQLYGINDGKAVGTYIEHRLRSYIQDKYDHHPGNTASGIDFPELSVDLKVTSIRQPQSSCPYRDAKQKVYGLGYHLLVFVYDKTDMPELKASQMKFISVFFIDKERTADFQTTKGILNILQNDGNQEDIEAFLRERNLPLDEIGITSLAQQIMEQPPLEGYLTISNALQWRLQYQRAMNLAQNPLNITPGIDNLLL